MKAEKKITPKNKEVEKTKGFLFKVKPSNKKRAHIKAINEGKTLSEVVDSLLFDYSAE